MYRGVKLRICMKTVRYVQRRYGTHNAVWYRRGIESYGTYTWGTVQAKKDLLCTEWCTIGIRAIKYWLQLISTERCAVCVKSRAVLAVQLQRGVLYILKQYSIGCTERCTVYIIVCTRMVRYCKSCTESEGVRYKLHTEVLWYVFCMETAPHLCIKISIQLW